MIVKLNMTRNDDQWADSFVILTYISFIYHVSAYKSIMAKVFLSFTLENMFTTNYPSLESKNCFCLRTNDISANTLR